jgi:hypothetical protein
MNLKEIYFKQYADNGLNNQLGVFQKKYKPKKGRRFNDKNITYEIGQTKIAENSIEFEISSKIPQDELKSIEGMKKYFESVKKDLLKTPHKPVSVKRENIIWDADKETEKSRDYVKVNYRVDFKNIYSEKDVAKKAEEIKAKPDKFKIPSVPGISTLRGRLVLLNIEENLSKLGNEAISSFIEVNEKVRKKLCKS